MISDKGANLGVRQSWMRELALADKELAAHAQALRATGFRYIRPPETGMVMVRGRAGSTGSPFSLGEMTITRCVVQLDDGRTGHSYIAGRDAQHAELAALADAHLQGPDHPRWMLQLLEPLRMARLRKTADSAQANAQSKVSFTTLVRGED